MDVPLRLLSNGLKNIRMDQYEGSFKFIVGDMQYESHPIIAEFLSPKIARIRDLDPTTSQYILQTRDPSSKFKDFLALAFDSNVDVAAEDFSFFLALYMMSISYMFIIIREQ